MIAEATSGRRSTQASPICAIVSPRSAAMGFSCFDRLKQEIRPEMPPGRLHEHVHLLAGRAAPRRRRLARRVFARQHAMRQRREGQVANSMARASRKDLALRLPPQHRVLRLAGRKRRQAACARNHGGRIDLLRRPLAEADGPCLACLHSPVKRSHRLLERRLLVEAVALVKIDRIHAQPLQRPFQLLLDLRRRKPVVRLVAHREIQLGGDHEPVSRIGPERLAQHPLRLARAILVGRIEERDPVIHGGMNAADRLLPRQSPRPPSARCQNSTPKLPAGRFPIADIALRSLV